MGVCLESNTTMELGGFQGGVYLGSIMIKTYWHSADLSTATDRKNEQRGRYPRPPISLCLPDSFLKYSLSV